MLTCTRCELKAKAKGLCSKHYQEMRRRTEPEYNSRAADREQARRDGRTPAQQEARRAYIRQWKTGFSHEAVLRCRQAQQGMCGICATVMRVGGRAHDAECADHCHNTRKPRGLLCHSCNRALGIYELRQKPAGLVISVYEAYLLRY